MDAAYGLRLRRGSYRGSVETVTGDEVSDLTASRDLKAMVNAGMLTAVGERRGRYYLAGDEVMELRARVRAGRSPKVVEDPFTLVRERRQLKLT
jgi:DNA-binding transcriptional ArsR family regulator